MKASDLMVRCLEKEGVQHVFGVPGEENEDLLFSLQDSKVQFIPTRHEQGAAFMADVYGRLTGRAGVCLATLGPGATNLITGVADAHLDKSPVVAITGQGGVDRLHKESHQFIDVVNMFKPIVKWNASITRPEIIPEVVRKAFKLSESEKPGATHFELPEDVAKLETDSPPMERERVRRPAADYKAVEKSFNIIKNAKRPVILAGNGAIRKLASKHLREFVEKTNIPVASTFMGKGAISDKAPQSLLTLGLKGNDHGLCVMKEADVVITIGYDIAEYDPDFWNIGVAKQIIDVDFLPAEVYQHYQPTVEVVGDISSALWEWNKRLDLEPIKCENWYGKTRAAILEDISSYSNDEVLTVPGSLNVLREVMHDDDILLSDVGSHKMWIARNYPAYEPNTVIISNGFASMGIALPGGIAAKLAHPGKRVVAAMGDGGFLMNSQELETAKRLGLGYVVLVFNDNNYGLITWKQENHTGKSFGTELTNPNFKQYAESFGIKGYEPKSYAELKQNLEEAINSNEVTLIGVNIDASVNAALSKRLANLSC